MTVAVAPIALVWLTLVAVGALWAARAVALRVWRRYRSRRDAADTAYADRLIEAKGARIIAGMEQDDQELRRQSAIERHRRALRSLQGAAPVAVNEMTPRLRQMRK